MDYFKLKYGLFSDKPDLLNNAPFLIKMKERFPDYIDRAEKTQMESRILAREDAFFRRLWNLTRNVGKIPHTPTGNCG